ncbi:tail fiber assembly protein [Xenorhabdus bovienii]|uniref:tail fiber assembly protein n=1 Tax=Xenorhabdus bovienii TaxID=40576 RepID=UPI003DA60996
MLHLKNFSSYSPENKEDNKIEREFNAIFYRTKDGQDWYKNISNFNKNTYKIKYDISNVICVIDKQASAICPENGSIVEMASLPDGVDISGNWQYINGDIVPREYSKDELIIRAKKRKQELLTKTNAVIFPLQDAIDLDIATAQETTTLTEWQHYRVMLNRVDCTTAPKIDWPKKPE